MWRTQSKLVLLMVVVLAGGGGLQAATVSELYVAQVPATALTGPALDEAFGLALDAVLVKVTGQRYPPAGPDRSRLKGAIAGLIRQYQPVPGGQLRVSFDPVALRQRLDAANLPVWADERPLVLVSLPPEADAAPTGAPEPALPSASGARQQLLATAAIRGLPLVIPPPSAASARTAVDPLRDPAAALEAAGADVLLVGRRAPTGGSAQWRWTLLQDGGRAEWQGDATDGAHGLADRLAARYATSAAAGRVLSLRIEDVASFDAYARVQSYLRSVDLIQRMDLQRITGGALIYEVAVRGDVRQLNDAFALQRVLEPRAASGPASPAGDLAYGLVAAP
ncbi:MAG: DUF2066 domain-containing protein [Gammaproteobacteria bacterium]